MEVLHSVFPSVPEAALLRVLEICDQNVEAASDWMLENNWLDLMENEAAADGVALGVGANGDFAAQQQTAAAAGVHQQQQQQDEEESSLTMTSTAAAPAPATGEMPTMVVSAHSNLDMNEQGHSLSTGDRTGDHAYERQEFETADQDLDSEDGEEDSREEDDEDEDEEEEDDDDDDDEDEDEDDDDGNPYYDSSEENFLRGSLPPMVKRVKVSVSDKKDERMERFWVSFDDEVVEKTLIELLNTNLSKLAHSRVLLLNQSSKAIDRSQAVVKLKPFLSRLRCHSHAATPSTAASSVSNDASIAAKSSLAKDTSASSSADPETPASIPSSASSVGQKRKRSEDLSCVTMRGFGFFAYFFPISDLDMVWRSMMHAHLFNNRFGDLIEFHTASGGSFHKRDFDELMYIHTNTTSRMSSIGISAASLLKCCLILSCESREDEIFRIGKYLHNLLKLTGSLYYRAIDLPLSSTASANVKGDVSARTDERTSEATTSASATASGSINATNGNTNKAAGGLLEENREFSSLYDEGRMTEDSFRRFAQYRIKKEELGAASQDAKDKSTLGVDHFLAYQQQKRVEYSLQQLSVDGWARKIKE